MSFDNLELRITFLILALDDEDFAVPVQGLADDVERLQHREAAADFRTDALLLPFGFHQVLPIVVATQALKTDALAHRVDGRVLNHLLV